MCLWCVQVCEEARGEGVEAPGAGVTHSFETSDVGAENHTRSSAGAASALNHRTTSAASGPF